MAARSMRFLPALAAAIVLVAVWTLTRLALALRPEVAALGGMDLVRAFAFGLVFDVVAASCFAIPLTLWLAIAPNRLARTRAYGFATMVWFCALCFAGLVLAVAEWLFWDEFGARFNFIAVDYLLYTHEVLGNIWQSYPVGRLLVMLAAAAAAITYVLRRVLLRSVQAPLRWTTRLGVIATHAALIAACTLVLDGDAKNGSGSDPADELAGNGVYEFFSALRRNELSFERFYATLPMDEALGIVRDSLGPARWIEQAPQGLERLEEGRGGEKHLNVVLVSVESLGAEFLGSYGDRRGLTPRLDALARESLWFSNVYATGNRTVRGLEALSLALPPTPGQSIVRRPKNQSLYSLGSVFEDKGYAVLFAYGGYGYFDNMNAFFDANDYRVVDRTQIARKEIEFENIWGVADEHLFDKVLAEIDREKAAEPAKPVFAHVMTTSNHRPYTYPAGRIDIPSGTGRDGAVKYTDYALGRLIERARSHAWFDDTVFVITADHGANARGTSSIPVSHYRIPVFVYAPKHVAPQRIDRLMSQIDIAPTLLGLLDFRYYTKFLGRDVLHASADGDRAFVANFQTLGYLRGDEMVVLRPKRSLERYVRANGVFVAAAGGPPHVAREAIAFYQVASHLFHTGLYGDEEQLPPEQRVARRE
ncbi:MAG TPA: sulfatase-like hydrolase/transferase [Burkholderiales bacterium]|nr:sulfatase-like hydrolase/transferase [Burkholderiales bacterium]